MSAKAVVERASSRPDYGVDAPRRVRQMFIRAATFVVLGAAVWLMNRSTVPGGGAAVGSILLCIGLGYGAAAALMRWSSRDGKARVAAEMLDAIPWKGDEKVLDAGCGRGFFLIAAAKRLTKPGKATGVDVWRSEDLSGNSMQSVTANAQIEGVSDRIKVDTGDVLKLPYSAGMFDVVLSSLVLHNLPGEEERSAAIQEMWRVLKPGGHLGILDIGHIGDYRRTLARLGANAVRESGFLMLWAVPTTRWLVVRKPV